MKRFTATFTQWLAVHSINMTQIRMLVHFNLQTRNMDMEKRQINCRLTAAEMRFLRSTEG
jgi:hypothetical protein